MSIDKVVYIGKRRDDVVNAPAPLAALGMARQPGATHFRRNHFPVPALDAGTWALAIGGAVAEPRVLAAADLRAFEHRTLPVVLECAGHRRDEFDPPAPGLRWGAGAASEARWTGVPLAAVLEAAGIADDGVEVVLRGADGDGYARSLPMEKALHPDTLLALFMNGEPIPPVYGGPVRAIVPGWYGMDSVKWLAAIHVARRPFDGPFQVRDYRWRVPGEPGPGSRIDRLAVQSLITSPAEGSRVPHGATRIRGAAWSGAGGIAAVAVSIDGGRFCDARLLPAPGPYARTLWEFEAVLGPGRHEIASRATDVHGEVQPQRPLPNAGGYCNNAVHRLGVTADEGKEVV